ncbi:ankyrin repeat domain-containing protein 26 isoform X2 [Scleropages formosus]|uniref:ankyrin repeat domain-containing protein 26 isoform X2 n=1 Tax=Scleropages formosus TaxID=113540 RepID=UPI0010FABAA1|nr:ankyrin repeat domain-containing protein 26-like isoform X2 [Scleropages formosus]
MKKIFTFGKKKKGFSPSSSETGSVLSLGYEIKEKDLGKVHRAASSGDLAKLKQLAKKNDLNQLDKENRTPLHIACANGHAEVVQFLVESKVKLNLCDNQNRSPLMKAVQCQQERCALTLLEHNADPNLVDINGNTALHLAASIPSIPLATQLLEHEANINALNNDGCTPLTLAVTENHVEIAEFLMKEGADVNARDQAQRTPLMIAACNGQTSLISLLLRYDADITVKDEKGWTADDYAVINGYHACSHLIIQHGTKRKSQHSPVYRGAGKNRGLLGSPAQGDNVGYSLGRPATNREVDEDNSQAESISRESKCGAGDSWPSSDEDDGLQSIPKKPQKVNLKKLLSGSENGRKNERPDFDKSWSESESERESEDEAKGNPALPLTIPHSGISQHPASPSLASFSNPPQMTSTPLSNSRKEQDSTEDEYDDDDEEEEECSDRKGSNEEDDVGETEDVRHGSSEKHSPIAAGSKMQKSKGVSKDVKRDFLSELGLGGSADEGEDSPWDSSCSDSPSKQNAGVVKAPSKGKKGTGTSEDNNEDLFYVPSFLRGPRNDRMAKVESLRSVGRPGDLKGQASRKDATDELGGKSEELPTQPVSVFPPASKDSSNSTKKIDLMEELGLGDIDDLEECQKKDSSDWDTSSSASGNVVGPKKVLSQGLGPPALEEETNPDCPVPALPADRREDLLDSKPEGEQIGNPRRSRTPSQSPPLPSRRTLTPRSTKQSQNQPQPQPRFRKHQAVAQDEGTPPPDTVPEDGGSDGSAEPEEPQEGKNVIGKVDLGVSKRKPCRTGPVESQNEGFHLDKNEGMESDEDEEQLSWERRYEKIWVEAEKREDAGGKLAAPPTHTVEEESSKEEEFVRPSASISLVPIIEQRESGLEDSLSEPKEALPSAVDMKPQLSSSMHGEKKTLELSSKNMVKDQDIGGAGHKTRHGEQDLECGMESYKGLSLGHLSCSITVDDDRAYLGPGGRGDGKGAIGDVRSPFFSHEGVESSRSPSQPIGLPSASLRPSDEEFKEDVQRFKHEVGGEKEKLLPDAGSRHLLWNPKEPSRKSDTEPDKFAKAEAGERDLRTDSSSTKENTTTQNEQKIKVKDGMKGRYVSQNPKRFSATENPKSKVTEEIEMADEFDDLTESSDTATEEVDSLASGYRNASLLIKQLDTSSIDSVSMVKLQNMFLEYERTVQREKGRSSRLAEKVSQLEGEQAELRRSLEETRDARSSLEHQHMELDSDFSNLKFVLKQEQEKHRNATALYDKSREQLRAKEEQYLREAEERQKLELTMRNLELEMRTLMNSMKQLEEDHNESQRLLAHERHARALQEGILNNHLHKQKEIEAENKRNLNKSNEAMSQLSEASDRGKDLLQQNRSLQEEATTLRLELEQARAHSRQEESRLSEESDALKERLEDAKRDLKLNEEALAQTVYQYNGQLSTLRAECSVLTAKLEHERQAREKLETEAESARARLAAALQEVERGQAARVDAERALQRERDEGQRALEKRATEAAGQRESIQSLSQQLGAAEARANGLENELHRSTLALTERSLLVETAQRERSQAQARVAELEAALQAEREVAERAVARQEATQERLAQTQSETMLLRQQLEDAQNRGVIKERAVTDAQERFGELLSKLRADCEERVRMAEDWSKEQVAKSSELQEQLSRQEQEKTERETTLRQLQQELADTLKKLSMCEASLEVNSRHRSDLEEEKLRMQKDVDRLKGRLQESEEQHFQTERRLQELQSVLKDKEREIISTSQKLQEVLSASEGAEKTIRQLEEAMQRLEIENARLDAVAKQQTNRIDFLQKGAQEAAVMTDSSPGRGVRNRLEDLVTDLQGSKIHLEDQLHREVKKQSELSHNVQDSHQLWEEELKTRSRLALRLAELEREKAELSSQMDIEKKKAKKIAEQKRSMDIRLDQEMKRNTELQKEMYRLKTLVKTAKKKLKEQDSAELGSPLGGLRGELNYRQLEAETTVTRMKSRVDELSLQLEREERKCSRLESLNTELKEQLSNVKALNRSNERLERSKRELEEEVSNLRRQMDAGMMDQSQAEQYRRETEERARQEIRQKLEEVNLFLQTQAASQEALEQMKAASEASLRAQLEQRIQDLESELNRLRCTQQDSASQKDSAQVQLERYRELYAEELKLRKSLAAKLERSNERLAEANTRLLHERQRSKSLIASSIVNGSLGGPSLEVGPLGSVGAYGGSLGPLNRSLGLGLGLGGTLLSPVASEPNSKVEAYLAKMQNELEKNISKELDKATVELDGRAARMSPVGSAGGSQWGLSADQDPVARATQQYLEVLKKNYKI